MRTMNRPTIITVSGAAGSGKDTIGMLIKDNLERRGYKAAKGANADFLKYVCRSVFNWGGVKDKQGRTLLQKTGERVRENSPDYWVSVLEDMVSNVLFDFSYFIVTDARYPNEIDYWVQKGYKVITIKIDRPDYENGLTKEQKEHESETALNDWKFDYIFTNDNFSRSDFKVNELLDNMGVKNAR